MTHINSFFTKFAPKNGNIYSNKEKNISKLLLLLTFLINQNIKTFMKKITSFLMMAAMCCTSVFAQEVGESVETQLPENKLVTVGTAQAEMVPGKWYFLQNARNGQNDSYEYFAVPGEKPKRGGLAEDRTDKIGLSTQAVLDEAMSEEGVSSEEYKKRMVRFVEVEGVEGAYNIQFGTGRWFGDGDPLNTPTITQNQYIAGLAGKWNFYLILNAEGQPNTAGRFGWNYYDMKNRVDNNGQGNSINFWNSGELTLEHLDWNQVDEYGDAGIIGNNVWQIFDIVVVGELDTYAEAFDQLIANYTNITSQGEGTIIDQLIAGEGVGNKPGNYRPEDVEAFLAIHTQVEELLMLAETEGMEVIQEKFPTAEDLEAFNKSYVDAWNHMISNKVPLQMTNITPGYYTFNSCLFWYTTKNDTVFYTAEEAEAANAESGLVEGDEGYIAAGDVKDITSTQVAAPKKALYSASAMGSDGNMADWMAWGTQQANAAYLWKVEAVEGKPTEYRMINMWNGKTHISIGQSSNSKLALNDTATVCFDFRNDMEAVKYADAEGNEVNDTVVSFNIRSSQQAENAYNYLHCGGHSGGAGTGSWIVGWSDGGATRWYMTPVDEATANQWIAEADKPKKLTAMITKADSIISAFPAQLEVAKDLVAALDTTVNVANADNFFSPFTCTSEGDVAQLFDGITNDVTNFWHSEWNSGSTNAYSTTNGTNYFVINDAEGLINGGMAIVVARRNAANDHVAQLTVYGTNDDYDGETALAALKTDVTNDGYTWTELGALNTPWSTNNAEIVTSNAIEFEGQYKFYKFVATHTVGSNYTDRGYFHMGEFQLYPATISKRYETTQYDSRKALADALSAAIAAWEEKGFAEDSLELLDDETFNAAYNALVSAAEAWGAVYVDPAALRAAIAAAPANNLFVTGNNPGQWKEGVVTPAAVVEAAEAYNASGAYTPAKSEEHIAAIAKAEADVWAAANKVETGKWYRISFATEDMYDTYNWDKTGSKATENEATGLTTSPALWGKTVAVGEPLQIYEPYETEEGEQDTLTIYSFETSDEWYEGNKLGFFEDEEFEEGEDLFRFIQATDSTYMIQNKATGLFIRGGYPVYLSAVPSYFDVKAIGAGANLIGSHNIFGGDEEGYNYLHGERSTNTLTTWDSENLASNSMLFIEEAEAVTEEPATEYTQKLWPGKVYTYTYPVDVTVSEGATAYGAEFVVSEEDTTVVLKAFAENKVAKGLPFILVADLEGEYATVADRQKAIAAEIIAESGQYGKNEKAMANIRLDEEYAEVTMDHGMEVDTLVQTTLSMRGTLKSATVEAGKAILAKENGFEHTLVNKTVGAYGAWIACDFDPESADVLGSISIKVEGEIESGINEVLNKVAKSGNIYNAAGQLVGKGNINTVNNLPAGIYVVNGVKVTKK